MTDRNEKIDKIRDILSEIEAEIGTPEDRAFVMNFDALEVPQLVASIVDFLQPLLTTYEAAIYWKLFRRSVLSVGQQYVRASVGGMMEGVVLSSSGQSVALGYRAVQKALKGLEEKGVITKAGEPNREGTLYKLYLPEEIAACQERMKRAVAEEAKPIDEKKEPDYYNVPENRAKVFERDDYKCWSCGKQLTRFTATLDHLQPVSKRGDNSFENLRTACLHCNSRRGNRPVMDVIDEAERRSRSWVR